MNKPGTVDKPTEILGPVEDFTPDPKSPVQELDGIKLGDIVTNTYWGAGRGVTQGRVYSIDPADEYPFTLQIYRESRWILGVDFEPGKVNLIYSKRKHLQLGKQEWTTAALCERLFKHMSHSLHDLDTDRADISTCHYKGCDKPTVQWILYNYVGSVYQFYVCQEHTSLHGICSESYPFEVKERLLKAA